MCEQDALAHVADKSLFYYGDWIKKPGVAIVSCNDGLRPVIMKLEATEEESKIACERQCGRMTYAIGIDYADAKLFPIALSAPDCGIIFAVDTTREEQLQ